MEFVKLARFLVKNDVIFAPDSEADVVQRSLYKKILKTCVCKFTHSRIRLARSLANLRYPRLGLGSPKHSSQPNLDKTASQEEGRLISLCW